MTPLIHPTVVAVLWLTLASSKPAAAAVSAFQQTRSQGLDARLARPPRSSESP
jgi:hypothetical protein